jgi:hypothetical protein
MNGKTSKHVLLLPLKSAGFKISEAKNLNFNVSFKLWSSCSKQIVRNKRGHPNLSKDLISKVDAYMKDNSKPQIDT